MLPAIKEWRGLQSQCIKKARELIDQAEDYRLFVVGELGRQFFKSQGYPVEEKFVYSANNPSIHRARMMTEYIIDLYQKEELDEVYIILTRMVNSLSEEAEIHRLLPMQTHKFLEEEMLEKSRTKKVELIKMKRESFTMTGI